MAQYLDFSISKKRAKGILDGEEDVKEEEQVQPEEPEEEVKQEELKDKITTVQKSMNFLEKAYSIQNMLMNILKETKQDQHDISSSLEGSRNQRMRWVCRQALKSRRRMYRAKNRAHPMIRKNDAIINCKF